MPTVELTSTQLAAAAEALQIALNMDEAEALKAGIGDSDYQPWTGAVRREVFETWAVLDAVAREHR